MNLIFFQRSKLALTVLVIGLASLLVWGSAGNLYQVKSSPLRRPVANLDDPQGDAVPDVQKYIGVAQQREMFKQSVIYETKKGPAVNILEGIQFLGVTKHGASIRAILFNSKNGISTSYAPGEMIGDLKINEIRTDRVVLSHGAETLELIR
ncbi:hypothetical protein LLG95_16740 [bacterium]|nr:hypothetical protein [bacterium]